MADKSKKKDDKKEQAAEKPAESGTLLEFIHDFRPEFESPTHLAPIVEAVERSRKERTFTLISTPPQHGKTALLTAAIAWLLRTTDKRHAYVSYSIDRGQDVSLEIQRLATAASVKWEGRRQTWATDKHGSLFATGIDGALTGEPVDGLLVIDDPLKNREEAESPVIREKIWNWFQSTAGSRLHPSSSIVVVQTRWHKEDLIGKLLTKNYKRIKWKYINLPAIDEAGKPLWPSQRPLDFLREQEELVGPYEWQSLYMGQPRQLGGELFGPPTEYTELPAGPLRLAFGVDLAYTARTRSDFSVVVKLAQCSDGRCYVLDVLRRQVHVDVLALELEAIAQQHPGVPWRWYGSVAGEQGAGDLIKARIPTFLWMPAKRKKFVRALPVSAAWRAGKVMVPAWNPPWKKAFVDVVTRFSGVEDDHDDDVDALAAAFDSVSRKVAAVYERERPLGLVQSWDAPRELEYGDEEELMLASGISLRQALDGRR